MSFWWKFLLFHAAAIPIAISLSESSGFILALVGGVMLLKDRSLRRMLPPGLVVPILLFIFYTVLMSLSGLQPEGSYKKLYRFLAFGTVVALPALVSLQADQKKALQHLLGAFLVGVAVLGVTDLIRIPLELRQGIDLFDTGNMRDPQFYMTALLLSAGSSFFLITKRKKLGWAATAFYITGLIFQFKRGAWLATVISLGGLAVLRRRWSILLAIALVGGGALLLPQTRERIAQLQDVTELRTGGRYALWTEVAPDIVQDYRWGIGFKQSSYELLRKYTSHIQPGLDHLHNNVLQIQVELGWVGLLLWLWIQISLIHLLVRSILRAGQSNRMLCHMAMALLAAFIGLHLQGVVEYNFGDTEILFLFTWIMGMAVAVYNLVQAETAHAEGNPS